MLGSCVPETCSATWTTHVQGFVVRGRAAADAEAIDWMMFDTAVGADAAAPPAVTSPRLMKLAK